MNENSERELASRRARRQADGLRALIAVMFVAGTVAAMGSGMTGAEKWAITMTGLLCLGAVLGAGWIAGGTWRD